VRRVTSPPAIEDVTESLHDSPTPRRHLDEGPTFLEVAMRRLSSVHSPIAIPEVTRGQSVHTIVPPTTSFCLGFDTQGIIATVIQVIGFEY